MIFEEFALTLIKILAWAIIIFYSAACAFGLWMSFCYFRDGAKGNWRLMLGGLTLLVATALFAGFTFLLGYGILNI